MEICKYVSKWAVSKVNNYIDGERLLIAPDAKIINHSVFNSLIYEKFMNGNRYEQEEDQINGIQIVSLLSPGANRMYMGRVYNV